MYSIVYYANGREVSEQSSSYTRADAKAAIIAMRREKPFPIIIKDDLGQIVRKING